MGDIESEPRVDEITIRVRFTRTEVQYRIAAALERGTFSGPFVPTVERECVALPEIEPEIEIAGALWALMSNEYAKRKRAEFVP
jgi:hypothetical protein